MGFSLISLQSNFWHEGKGMIRQALSPSASPTRESGSSSSSRRRYDLRYSSLTGFFLTFSNYNLTCFVGFPSPPSKMVRYEEEGATAEYSSDDTSSDSAEEARGEETNGEAHQHTTSEDS